MTNEDLIRLIYKDNPSKAQLMIDYCGKSEAERLAIYDTGVFNRITEGYMIMVFEELGLGVHISDAISALQSAHDSSRNPLIAYDRWLQH